MRKEKSQYVCQSCGHITTRWFGRCPECGGWNTLVEEILPTPKSTQKEKKTFPGRPIPITEIPFTQEARIPTTVSELDRVLGGGLVPGAVFLVSGLPGMGKSTLLLQTGACFAEKGKRVFYISGEESLIQIKMRAERLSANANTLFLFSETDVDVVAETLRTEKPDLAIVDSVQTVFTEVLEGLPGNVSQVRYVGQVLTKVAKETGIPLFLVGQVTKEGTIAGPRVLEHLVDGLLFLEGDEQHLYRILRGVKNRFGSTNEVGLFEMTDQGMREISNPSEFLLSSHQEGAPGTAITVSMEGTRPLLVEVQGLVSPTGYGIPQRACTGIDPRRVSMLLAVLERRLGLRFGNQDVFVNAVGGLHLFEPCADLAIACAVVSSFKDKPISARTVLMGEIGLTGEVRGITHLEQRIQEAVRLGFDRIIVPRSGLKALKFSGKAMFTGVETLRETIKLLFE